MLKTAPAMRRTRSPRSLVAGGIRSPSDPVETDQVDEARHEHRQTEIHERRRPEMLIDPHDDEQPPQERRQRRARDETEQPRRKVRARNVDHGIAPVEQCRADDGYCTRCIPCSFRGTPHIVTVRSGALVDASYPRVAATRQTLRAVES